MAKNCKYYEKTKEYNTNHGRNEFWPGRLTGSREDKGWDRNTVAANSSRDFYACS